MNTSVKFSNSKTFHISSDKIQNSPTSWSFPDLLKYMSNIFLKLQEKRLKNRKYDTSYKLLPL